MVSVAERSGGSRLTTVLRRTGLPQLLSCYRYFAFSGPRVTTALGVMALCGIVAFRVY
ncbi:MAG: hypothetical protein ACRDS0_27970 [Pseudonocardiaceae bacterium]